MRLDDNLRRFLVKAIGTLKGTRRQKDVAVAYAEAGSEKAGAARLGMKLPTAKAHMQKLYRNNGVDCIMHVILSGCHNLFSKPPTDHKDTQDDQPSPPGLARP